METKRAARRVFILSDNAHQDGIFSIRCPLEVYLSPLSKLVGSWCATLRELCRSGNSSRVWHPLLVRGRRGIAENCAVSYQGWSFFSNGRDDLSVGGSLIGWQFLTFFFSLVWDLLLPRHKGGEVRHVPDLRGSGSAIVCGG
ncbi:hypothetical protein IGI04_022980 [Brassica rapa subsp. trilocularis]|uniref:Uncharacterized protein n=2 Tax=Brassica campestris TaxID=3711 RepID=M4DNF1_BRACM|nr:hypothetical protein IGI04_022980 [Brassica rapa subsp. trilocularis]